MKTIKTTFQIILFVLSGLALILSCYQLVTVEYPTYNFVAILVFNIPVLMSFFVSGSLLIEKK